MTTDIQERLRREGEIRALVDDLTPWGLTIAVRMLGSREEGEEAVQDALTRLLRSAGSFREESLLSTWFIRITINECKRRIARRRPRSYALEEIPERELESPRSDPLQELEKVDQIRVLKKAIARLPQPQSQALNLYYLEDCSCAEVGKILKLDKKVVGVYIFRARKAVGQMLKKGKLVP